MRSSFLLASGVLAAATLAAQPARIGDLEKDLLTHPANWQARWQILQLLWDRVSAEGMPYDQIVETRRRHVLWLIENHPDSGPSFEVANRLIPPRGLYADPEGYAESVRLWKQIASRPDAAPRVVANAAIYMKAAGRTAARALLDAALERSPDAHELWSALGMVDAAAAAGLTGAVISFGGPGQFIADPALRDSTEAKAALREIESARNAWLLSGASGILSGAIPVQNFAQIRIGEEDAQSLAERWLRRAVSIDPAADEIRLHLFNVVRAHANGTEDPAERARLFREALTLARDSDRPEILVDVAKAEFEAGQDADSSRDAQRALDAGAGLRNRNQAALIANRAHTVLGRIALARGDLAEARVQLRASLDVPADAAGFRSNGPDMTLAADLADSGERDAVISYLESARAFWLYDRGLIDRYIRLVKAGKKRAAFDNNVPGPGFDLLNQPAPAFTLHDASGREWTLASLGGKPATLIFFNLACRTCAAQLADFEKAGVGNVQFLAIDVADDDAAVRSFAEKNHILGTVLMGARDPLARAFHVDSFPTFVEIDSRGRIVQFQQGAQSNPRQTIENAARPGLDPPAPLSASPSGSGIAVAWTAATGAQSYLIEWEPAEPAGWLSDRDGFLRVIATRDNGVTIPFTGKLRWRVYAVGFGVKSEPGAWQIVP